MNYIKYFISDLFSNYKMKHGWRRSKKEILEYENEAFSRIWLDRSYLCGVETENILKAREEILSKYPDIPEEYSDWEWGFWNGVLGTLRWVLGEDDKQFLDT
jgi:hypothetical protein